MADIKDLQAQALSVSEKVVDIQITKEQNVVVETTHSYGSNTIHIGSVKIMYNDLGEEFSRSINPVIVIPVERQGEKHIADYLAAKNVMELIELANQ